MNSFSTINTSLWVLFLLLRLLWHFLNVPSVPSHLCALINHCLLSRVFSQNFSSLSTLFTKKKKKVLLRTTAVRGFPQNMIHGGWETKDSSYLGWHDWESKKLCIIGGLSDIPYRWIRNICSDFGTNFLPRLHCTPFFLRLQ